MRSLSFFLFAVKSHVEIVSLGTIYFGATNDLGFPLSISCNLLNLSSMEIVFSFLIWACFFIFLKTKTRNWMHFVKLETFQFLRHLSLEDLWNSFLFFFQWNEEFQKHEMFIENTFERSTWIIPLFNEVSLFLDGYHKYCETWTLIVRDVL